jgi:hypothetical protein
LFYVLLKGSVYGRGVLEQRSIYNLDHFRVIKNSHQKVWTATYIEHTQSMVGAGVRGVSAMVAHVLRSELAFAFHVGLGEVALEEDEGPEGVVEVAPLVKEFLLEELEGGVLQFAQDGGENGMREWE